jgi:hypothetical protein
LGQRRLDSSGQRFHDAHQFEAWAAATAFIYRFLKSGARAAPKPKAIFPLKKSSAAVPTGAWQSRKN